MEIVRRLDLALKRYVLIHGLVKLMSRLVHQLKSLWVLDVVLRTGSFTAAAERLNVTQSAVSQHVKALEEEFGPLFERGARSLAPTQTALRLGPHLRKGFDHLEEGVEAIRRCCNQITVSVLPSFASAWLIPRLHKFNAEFPDIDIRITMSNDVVDFRDADVDAGIRFSSRTFPELIVKDLAGEEIFLAASPELAKGIGSDLRVLKDHVLVDSDAPDSFNWSAWKKAAGHPELEPRRRIIISDSSQVIRLALAGQAVALVRRILVQEELSAGRLVKLFDFSLQIDQRYLLVMPTRSRGNAALRHFTQWLQQEIEAASAPQQGGA
ncbi:LysR family transcriptional regulator [Hahella sp. KA22]|nr:LysR family transcriptional regulator [Hahella sp. KA22]QAY57912.1 LysR family transcriptional regulator [Hahella sp. KA22]